MNIKGSAVKSIKDYVETNHPEKLDEWLNSLPEDSKKLFSFPIYATNWYPIDVAAIIPTEKIGEIIFNSADKGAWELGRYSADIALNGIYKVFIRVLNPAYLIQRASKILPTYYSPSKMEAISQGKKSVTLHVTEFENPHSIIDQRIAGWIERALEITKCKDISINISKSMAKGDDITEFQVSWN
ncbi:hypothetical protein ACFLTE_00580 [Bacteroidota bacterium]